MEKRAAAPIILLAMLEALLLVAGLSAAAAGGSGDSGDDAGVIIRLPTDTASGIAEKAAIMPAGNEERPWKCCSMQQCTTSSWPPLCWCKDLLDQCSRPCRRCSKDYRSSPPRYICEDAYRGQPAPRCNNGAQGIQTTVQGGPEEMAVVTKEGNGEKRPWKCCDKAVTGPTTEGKVVWYCMDKVKKCTCDRCFKLEGSHNYYYCLDAYHGSDPGPSCAHE